MLVAFCHEIVVKRSHIYSVTRCISQHGYSWIYTGPCSKRFFIFLTNCIAIFA
jgi:hypothetical protein